MYLYISNIFLGINQLILHLIAFVVIETCIFYLFIIKNMKKSITNMFRRVGCKTYKQVSNKKSKNIKIFTSDSDYQNQINEDMKKKRKFIQKYITHTNHTVIILIIGIILSLLLLLTLLHLIGSKYKIKVEYNAITTIVSLLISIPIQIYYINNYIIMESDPKNLIIIYEQINKYLLE